MTTNFNLIQDNIDFILSHFEGQHELFPRTIMSSKTGGQVNIEYESDIQKSKDKIFEYFSKASFTDCKINAFSFNTEYTLVDLEVKNRIAASFIMIDLDLKDFSDNVKLGKQLKKTLKMLSLKFHEESHPTVLWTGNGYHIYQPIEGFVFEKYKEFYAFMQYIDTGNLTTEFLRFAKNLFTEGKADSNHRPSIKSCLLRVPGTFNSKNWEQVKVIQKWDGKRPSVKCITSEFMIYLIQKRIDKIKEKKRISFYSHKQRPKNKQINEIRWIENLLQTPIEDCRKQCLWRILCPYLINIRKLTSQESSIILNEWLKKCSELRPLDPIITKTIKHKLKNEKQFFPILSKDKLKDQCVELYKILISKNIFAD